MFSCNVNANEKLTSIDLSSYIPQCTYELFSKKMTNQQKSDICFIAYMYKGDEFKKNKDLQIILATFDLLVKSCNYSRSKSNKLQNKACNDAKDIYNRYCMNCGIDYENCSYSPDVCMILERLK
jgi:hypothetical protein